MVPPQDAAPGRILAGEGLDGPMAYGRDRGDIGDGGGGGDDGRKAGDPVVGLAVVGFDPGAVAGFDLESVSLAGGQTGDGDGTPTRGLLPDGCSRQCSAGLHKAVGGCFMDTIKRSGGIVVRNQGHRQTDGSRIADQGLTGNRGQAPDIERGAVSGAIGVDGIGTEVVAGIDGQRVQGEAVGFSRETAGFGDVGGSGIPDQVIGAGETPIDEPAPAGIGAVNGGDDTVACRIVGGDPVCRLGGDKGFTQGHGGSRRTERGLYKIGIAGLDDKGIDLAGR